MHQILRSNLPPDEKWKKYEQLFNQYQFYKNLLERKLTIKDVLKALYYLKKNQCEVVLTAANNFEIIKEICE